MRDEIKKSVLIVDDEMSNLVALTQILNKEYTVYAATGGSEAIEAAKINQPDLILLDIIMPEMDGYEVISILKCTEETRSIPVIFVTGLGTAAEEEKGLLLGASDYISKPFNSAIVKLRVQNQIQLALQFDLIMTLSLTDELTGLSNRRGFNSRLNLELNHAKREQIPLSIMMIDIDNFKDYNDKYGHLQGDKALKTVGGVINDSLKRSVDFCARWGGEEFIVLLQNSDLSGALKIAEVIRGSISETQISCEDGSFTGITVSIGVNTVIPRYSITVNNVVDGADHALYAAKQSGKNKVCVYDEKAQ
ncbi:MAG: diguanylate cyclase [Lachnospiraceae bacterium]|nr:diguanylate cyclase [Lachnospiraceae bacterium]